MCKRFWSWLFPEIEPVVLPEYTENTITSIVVGDYPGTANDLTGPPYDPVNFKNRIIKDWPNYVFRPFKDDQSTKARFFTELDTIIGLMKPGDLLVFIMDNCFPETNTRELKDRIYSPSENLRYIAMSAARYYQTASDLGNQGGAYHNCLITTLEKGITWREWDRRTQAALERSGFDQVCTIEGADDLLDRKVFEGVVRVLEISSHGSTIPDKNGDEPDHKDEAIVLVDGLVIDDEIAEKLKKLPV